MKLNAPLLPFLVVLLILLQLITPQPAWTALLVGLGGLWVIGLLWAHSLSRGLQLVRELRFGWAQVGDQLEERFTLINRSRLPALWVEVLDHSTLPACEASTVTGVGGEEENSWTVKTICVRRGAFRLGPTTLRTGDPFGVYSVRLEYPAAATMTVMPPIVPLPAIEVAAGGRAGEGREQVNTFERTVMVSSVRDYSPGDRLSSIHWRTVARRDQLYTKLFDSAPASDWWIVLDVDASVQGGVLDDSTLENGIILAASLTDRGVHARRAVGLIACGDELVWIPPLANSSRLYEILHALALIGPGRRPLTDLLSQLQPALGRQASLIVITPDLNGNWLQPLLRLRLRGLEPTVLLLDAASSGRGGTEEHSPLPAIFGVLTQLGICHSRLTGDLFARPEARPGRQGQWDWRVSATGKARALEAPRDLSWRVLP